MRIKLFLFLTLLLLLASCGPKEETLSIGTSGQTGAWYPIGTSMSQIINDNMDDLNTSAEVTGGSIENVVRIENGELDIAMTNDDAAYLAFNGEGEFEEEQDVVQITGLFNSVAHIIVLDDSEINSLSDLNGENVSLGPPGSSGETLNKELLELNNIQAKETTLEHDEALEALKTGQLSAAMVMTPAPQSGIEELNRTDETRLIDLTNTEIENLTNEHPYYLPYTVPAETYSDQEKENETVSLGGLIVTDEDFDEDTAYDIVKHVFENLDTLKESHPLAEQIQIEDIEDHPIPVHPGAIKYYEEQGIELE